MSKMDTEKKNLKIQKKLSLNRETLRKLSAEQLDEVAGGWRPTPTDYCVPATTRCTVLTFP
jgi:hypothetical protein